MLHYKTVTNSSKSFSEKLCNYLKKPKQNKTKTAKLNSFTFFFTSLFPFPPFTLCCNLEIPAVLMAFAASFSVTTCCSCSQYSL